MPIGAARYCYSVAVTQRRPFKGGWGVARADDGVRRSGGKGHGVAGDEVQWGKERGGVEWGGRMRGDAMIPLRVRPGNFSEMEEI
jgi:hypothetical protein